MFDYLILDEAQAIKNAESQAAKAARLLKGRHRLAMSVRRSRITSVNSGRSFEFLNPGMLGPGSAFKRFTGGTTASDEARARSCQGSQAFYLETHQERGRQGSPRQDRADALVRHGAPAAAIV